MTDFIDRAKLEALADEYSREESMDAWEKRYDDFMAGAAAHAALLDAETTEDWGTSSPEGELKWTSEDHARAMARPEGIDLVSRRVLYGSWLPSEGGEKP